MRTHSSRVRSRVPGFCGILLAMIALAVTPIRVFAAEHWIKVTSPHFELFTPGGAKRAREAILHFERDVPAKCAADLNQAGFGQGEIVEIIAVVAPNVSESYVNNVKNTEIDAVFAGTSGMAT